MFINSTVNKHYHLLLNGQIIEHAHPFNTSEDASPFKNHKHTNNEIILLTLVSNPVFAVFLVTIFLFQFSKKYEQKKTIYNKILIKETYKKFPSNKSPPAFLYF